MLIGYARVSSFQQNLERQIRSLKDFGCNKVFADKISGKNFDRPEYQKMKSKLRFGDTLVIPSLSRLGRSKQGILDEWKELMKEDIDIVVLDMPILDTRKYKDLEGIGQLITDIVLQLLSWMVEEERTNIRENQRQGIEIAKIEGKYNGRKVKYHANATGKDKIIYDKIIEMLNLGKSVIDIHDATGVARNTIYRIKRDKENNERI
ncbi:DNA invertase Pin-like site-specific DNA recombinase [Scopulibacillus darangshiensis]|uniref:DNA invertase Pin-like site-specific DNA recombinase n=1 Tax=Scopulibacillus darangshiensis TaxID=442528 RepID=A0A4R2NRJ9_9BACL|nr:recombinase family protein [Scopulibacillus darangshiensis]TCP24480.1 DNA invertase Pin-like site-specific DNA recombinase [Scopulibacillus darangshiensis]